MYNCIKDAGIKPTDIEYINAHGTSTPSGDQIEAMAIDKLLKIAKKHINVTSTKSQTGHLLGAAGAVEASFSIMSILNNKLPYNLNLENELSSKKLIL